MPDLPGIASSIPGQTFALSSFPPNPAHPISADHGAGALDDIDVRLVDIIIS